MRTVSVCCSNAVQIAVIVLVAVAQLGACQWGTMYPAHVTFEPPLSALPVLPPSALSNIDISMLPAIKGRALSSLLFADVHWNTASLSSAAATTAMHGQFLQLAITNVAIQTQPTHFEIFQTIVGIEVRCGGTVAVDASGIDFTIHIPLHKRLSNFVPEDIRLEIRVGRITTSRVMSGAVCSIASALLPSLDSEITDAVNGVLRRDATLSDVLSAAGDVDFGKLLSSLLGAAVPAVVGDFLDSSTTDRIKAVTLDDVKQFVADMSGSVIEELTQAAEAVWPAVREALEESVAGDVIKAIDFDDAGALLDKIAADPYNELRSVAEDVWPSVADAIQGTSVGSVLSSVSWSDAESAIDSIAADPAGALVEAAEAAWPAIKDAASGTAFGDLFRDVSVEDASALFDSIKADPAAELHAAAEALLSRVSDSFEDTVVGAFVTDLTLDDIASFAANVTSAVRSSWDALQCLNDKVQHASRYKIAISSVSKVSNAFMLVQSMYLMQYTRFNFETDTTSGTAYLVEAHTTSWYPVTTKTGFQIVFDEIFSKFIKNHDPYPNIFGGPNPLITATLGTPLVVWEAAEELGAPLSSGTAGGERAIAFHLDTLNISYRLGDGSTTVDADVRAEVYPPASTVVSVAAYLLNVVTETVAPSLPVCTANITWSHFKFDICEDTVLSTEVSTTAAPETTAAPPTAAPETTAEPATAAPETTAEPATAAPETTAEPTTAAPTTPVPTCPYKCPDAECAASLAACSCVSSLSISNLTTSVVGVDSVTGSVDPRVEVTAVAAASYSVLNASSPCHAYPFAAQLKYRWTVAASNGTAILSQAGSTLRFSASRLGAGKNFTLTVNVTGIREQDTHSVTSVLRVVVPDPRVSVTAVLGTVVRTSNSKPLTIPSTIEDTAHPVDSAEFEWSCSIVDSAAACPLDLSNQTARRVVLPANSPAGEYDVALLYRTRFSSTIRVVLLAAEVPLVRIVIGSTAVAATSPPLYQSGGKINVAVSVVYNGSVNITWFLNEDPIAPQHPTATSLAPHAALLHATPLASIASLAYTLNSLRVRATAVVDSETPVFGEAVTTFAVLPAVAVDVAASATGTPVALSGDVSLTVSSAASSSGLPAWLPVEYSFSFADGESTRPLRTSLVSTGVYRATAPLTQVLAGGAATSDDVTFRATLRLGGFEVATGSAVLAVAAPQLAAAVSSQIEQASLITDPSAAMEATVTMQTLLNASANATQAAEIAVAVVRMLANSVSDVTALSKEQQGSLFESLSTASSHGAAAHQDELKNTTKNLLSSALATGALDPANGKSALGAIATLTAADAAQFTSALSSILANDPEQPIATPRTVEAGGIAITVVKQVASSLGNSSVSGGSASMTIPTGMQIPGLDENAVVGVATTSYAANPFGGDGSSQPASAVVSFELSSSSTTALHVVDIDPPLVITLAATGTGALVCKFWDTAAGRWSTHRVTTAVNADGSVRCSTTHLTSFASFSSASSSSSESSNAALIGGIVGGVGGLLVVGVVVVLCVARRRASASNVESVDKGNNPCALHSS